MRQNIIKDLSNKCEKALEYLWLKHYETPETDNIQELIRQENKFNKYREKYIKRIDKVKNEHTLTKLEEFLSDLYHNQYLKARSQAQSIARQLLTRMRHTQ